MCQGSCIPNRSHHLFSYWRSFWRSEMGSTRGVGLYTWSQDCGRWSFPVWCLLHILRLILWKLSFPYPNVITISFSWWIALISISNTRFMEVLKMLISAWIILDFLIFMIISDVVTKRVSCFFIGTVEEWCVVNQAFLWILSEKNSEGRGNGDCQQQKGRHTKATHSFLGARGYVSTDPSLKPSLGN